MFLLACKMPDFLTRSIIGAAIEVHTALGPGLLENTYKECLYFKLCKNGFEVEKEKLCQFFLKKLNWIVVIELICL